MSNILIIEDELRVLEVLKDYLKKEGYNVYCVSNGKEGIQLFKKIDFKLVILDLRLPDMDGEEVCKILRKMSDVYIFIFTAKASLARRIECLEMGADQYLVKPQSPREITARVNALFRRLNNNELDTMIFDNGKLRINYNKRKVVLYGEEILLTANEFDILYILASSEGIPLSREQLIDKVFGFDYEGFDRVVDVHIKNIRKKIEKDSKSPKYIKTVNRIGYKFEVGDN